MKTFFLYIALLGLILLGGCTMLPHELRTTAPPLPLSQGLAHPEKHRGQTVRWGGTILKIENAADETRIQILTYPLDRSGRPRIDREPSGRFLARTSEFLDPAIYAPGRELTVVGILAGVTEISIDRRKIHIPVIDARRWYLWPKREAAPAIYHPIHPYWWYDFWFYYPWPPYYYRY